MKPTRAELLASLEDLLAIAELSPCAPETPDEVCKATELCGREDCKEVGCVVDKIREGRRLLAAAQKET